MASIERIKGSDGSGNASVATVQSTRSGGASTIIVDTVLGINTVGFEASMGTPHTFTDPITSETITVISEATAVDFTGHVDGSNLEIDTIAPGYVDNGSAVGDIIIIRPTTQWSDNLAETLEVSHNDDGTLKDDAVTTDVIDDLAVTTAKIAVDAVTAPKIDWAATGAGGGIWWEEIGRTTLGVAGDTISVTPIAARKYLRILISIIPTGGNTTQQIRFNNDSSGNYAIRVSTDYAAATTATAQTSILPRGADTVPSFLVLDVINIETQEKEVIVTVNSQGTAGAGNLPSSTTAFAKWVNTGQQITRVDVVNGGTGDYAIGSEVIVLGHN
jgi:hypothetical protein